MSEFSKRIHFRSNCSDDGGTIINFGSLGSSMGTNIYSLAPNNKKRFSVCLGREKPGSSC
jgi:hypothetical protein